MKPEPARGQSTLPGGTRGASALPALLLAALLLASGTAQALETLELEHRGRTRQVLLDRPPVVAHEAPRPMIVFLHGALLGAGIHRTLNRFHEAAPASGVVYAMPAADGPLWQDGALSADLGPFGSDADDIGFLDAVLDRLVAERIADPARIHLVGQSNGGMMALAYACRRSDRLASLTVLLATPAREHATTCRPPRAIPVTFILGRDDPYTAWDGRLLAFLPRFVPDRMSADSGLVLWRSLNGCGGEAQLRDLPRRDPAEPGTSVVEHQPSGCPLAAPVTLFEMLGVGHRFPGNDAGIAMRLLLGRGTRDLDAVALVLERVLGAP